MGLRKSGNGKKLLFLLILIGGAAAAYFFLLGGGGQEDEKVSFDPSKPIATATIKINPKKTTTKPAIKVVKASLEDELVEEEVISKPAPTPKKAIVKKPKPIKKTPVKVTKKPAKSVGFKPYVLNIASFRSKKEAGGMVKNLKADGHLTYVAAATVKGVKWYRVRVGFFSTASSANKVARKISAKHPDASPWASKVKKKEHDRFAR
ncbi:MAG: SPOR domain-containing protein [Deltaproteobacteria bacterium]|nr:SPOR domain-containing protein [Deltaproteobacteria bacterium]